MGTTLKELLAPNAILGMVDILAGEIPQDHLPPGLLGGATTQPIVGDTGYILRGSGTHRAAKQAMRGSVARPVTINSTSKRPEVLLHSAESMEIKADDCRSIIDFEENPGSDTMKVKATVSRMAIANIQKQAFNRSMNLRTVAVTTALSLGHIYFDVDGEILASSANAVIDVDYGIPAANKDQVSGIIDASWGTSSTKIVSKHLDGIKVHARKQSGRRLKHAIYGSAIKNYLMSNTEAKEYLFRNMALNEALAGSRASGNGPDVFTLGGMTWWPGYESFYRNSSDTATDLVASDAVIFLPDPSPDWYQMQEGMELVPGDDFGGGSDLQALFAKAITRQGIFQYADGKKNPLRGELVYGDNFLPAIHVPEAIVIADVAF